MSESAARVVSPPEGAVTALQRVENEIRRLAETLLPSRGSGLEAIARTTGAYLMRPGKRVRARLCLAGETLCTQRAPSQGAVAAAAALETIHAFLLIHDDLMDRAETRRGKPALHVALRPPRSAASDRFGEDLALVAGDWLYTVGLRALLQVPGVPASARLRVIDLLLDVCTITAQGQALDVVNGLTPLPDVTPQAVLETYRLKTGRYTFEAPLLAGALLAGAPDRLLEKLRAFSLSAGVAFQLVDDLLGLFASDEELGKPAVTDLAEGKKTWPLVRAYALASEADRAWLTDLLQKRAGTLDDLKRVRAIVVGTGALRDSLAQVRELLEEAEAQLAVLPAGPANEELRAIVQSIQSTARGLASPVSVSSGRVER